MSNSLQQPTATSLPRGLILDLLLVVVIAGGARFIGLGQLDPWEDEVYSFIGSGDLLNKQLMWTGQRMALHSPLPYIEIKFARALLGPGAFGLRFPAACYGTLAVAAFYLLLRRMIDRPHALFGALILAVHPFALEWARDARMYSHWLATSAVMMILAYEAARYAREDANPSAVNWRWWTLGVVFNWAHCSALFAVTTIAAVGLWLGLIALANLRERPRSALVILFGAALATGVYLTGWSLNGIGRLMLKTSPAGASASVSAADHAGSKVFEAINHVVRALGGDVPFALAVVLVGVALVGLVMLIVRGRFEAVLLLALVAITPWLAYRGIAKQHFFAPRYVIVELLALCAGWATVGVWCVDGARKSGRFGPRLLTPAVAVVLMFLWLPAWRNIYTVAKMPYSTALAPIAEFAHDGDALIPVPEWYVQLGQWYSFPDPVKVIAPPIASRIFSGVNGDFESMEQLGYDADFNATFSPADAGQRPLGAWVFMVGPSRQRIESLEPLFAAYGLSPVENVDTLVQAAQDRDILSFRVTGEGVAHVTTSRGRRDAWWW